MKAVLGAKALLAAKDLLVAKDVHGFTIELQPRASFFIS